jgi:hypothetical protein
MFAGLVSAPRASEHDGGAQASAGVLLTSLAGRAAAEAGCIDHSLPFRSWGKGISSPRRDHSLSSGMGAICAVNGIVHGGSPLRRAISFHTAM